MPRKQVYTMPRSRIYFRIDAAKYEMAVQRGVELGFPTFNKYLEHLIDDDLIIQSIEKRKELLAAVKGASQ